MNKNTVNRGYEVLAKFYGDGSGHSKKYWSQAVECTDGAGKIRCYPSVRKASERHLTAVNSIIRACKNGKPTTNGLLWRYLSDGGEPC